MSARSSSSRLSDSPFPLRLELHPLPSWQRLQSARRIPLPIHSPAPWRPRLLRGGRDKEDQSGDARR